MREIKTFFECENKGIPKTVILKKKKLSHISDNTATDRVRDKQND